MVETAAHPASGGARVIIGKRWSTALPWGVVCRLGRIPAYKTLPLSWMLAQDPRHLCKRLELQGWELWPEAESCSPDRPLQVRVTPNDHWPLAVWSVAYYRGPVTLVWLTGGDAEERFWVDPSRWQVFGDVEAKAPAIEAHLGMDSTIQVDLTLTAHRRGRRLGVLLEREDRLEGAPDGSASDHR